MCGLSAVGGQRPTAAIVHDSSQSCIIKERRFGRRWVSLMQRRLSTTETTSTSSSRIHRTATNGGFYVRYRRAECFCVCVWVLWWQPFIKELNRSSMALWFEFDSSVPVENERWPLGIVSRCCRPSLRVRFLWEDPLDDFSNRIESRTARRDHTEIDRSRVRTSSSWNGFFTSGPPAAAATPLRTAVIESKSRGYADRNQLNWMIHFALLGAKRDARRRSGNERVALLFTSQTEWEDQVFF